MLCSARKYGFMDLELLVEFVNSINIKSKKLKKMKKIKPLSAIKFQINLPLLVVWGKSLKIPHYSELFCFVLVDLFICI